MPFLPLYIRQLGVTDVGSIALWTGATLGVTPALSALLSPFWGRLADRFGRKIMVVRSLVSCSLVMAAMAYVTAAWHLFALRALLGFFTGYGGLTLTMAADSVPREQMAGAIGRVQTAQRLGPALGPAIGGVLAGWLGLRPAFLVAAAFYAVALALVLALYAEPSPVRSQARGLDAPAAPFTSILRLEHFGLLLGVAFGTQFADRSIGPILALHVEHLGVAAGRVAAVAGMLFSVIAVAAAIGHHVAGRLLRRRAAGQVIRGASTAGAIGALLFAVAPAPLAMIPGAVLFGAGSGTAMTAVYATAGAVVPRSAQGAGFGLLNSASLTGVAASPVVAGLLGGASLRGVFVLDILILAMLGWVVHRRMVSAGGPS
jgi:DHA1 family multidrug resistance protein-like MFS transporter